MQGFDRARLPLRAGRRPGGERQRHRAGHGAGPGLARRPRPTARSSSSSTPTRSTRRTRAREPYFAPLPRQHRRRLGRSGLRPRRREPHRRRGFLINPWLQERVPGPAAAYRPSRGRASCPSLRTSTTAASPTPTSRSGRLLDRLRQLGLERRDRGRRHVRPRRVARREGLGGPLQPLGVRAAGAPRRRPARRGEAAGQRVPTRCDWLDLAPTILDLVDLDPLPGVDGRSLVPLLEGRRRASRRRRGATPPPATSGCRCALPTSSSTPTTTHCGPRSGASRSSSGSTATRARARTWPAPTPGPPSCGSGRRRYESTFSGLRVRSPTGRPFPSRWVSRGGS